MSRPELVVPVADLERGAKQVVFVLSESWLNRALEDTGATILGPGELDVTLSKNSGEVLVRGALKVDLTLPCVVTLDPVAVPVRTEILLMLSPRSGASVGEEQATRHRARARKRKEAREAAGLLERPPREQLEATPEPSADKPRAAAGQRRPENAKSAGKGEGHWEETPVLTDEDAGKDTYEGHEIALDDFVREFLILELPMFPRRSDLPTGSSAANPPLPADNQPGGDPPLDPRLSPLAELKSRLEKLKKE